MFYLCFETKTLSLTTKISVMELRIKELLQEQGLRMADLADRLGMNQSNLVRSLSTNPKLSTLQDVAKALNVQLHELFTRNLPTSPRGMAVIAGRTYELVETANTLQIPFYKDYSVLRQEIKNFVANCFNVKENNFNAFCGIVGGFELVSLLYDRANTRFILTIYYGDKESETLFFDRMEYTKWKNEQDEEPELDIDQMAIDIIAEIENLVPFKYGDYTTPADKEIENE